MFNYFSERYKEIIVVLILVLTLVSVNSKHRIERKYNWYDHVVLTLTYPLQKSFNYIFESVSGVIQNYFILTDIKKDNKFLLKQTRKLNNRINSLDEIKKENVRLRKFLDFKQNLNFVMLPAEVIAVDLIKTFRTIRINKGYKNGIKLNYPVVTYQGVIGKVIKLSRNYSDVLLITDKNSAADSLVQRTRVRGISVGMSTDSCKLKYLNRIDDVKKGDRIVTSGLAGIYPKGLLVGTVTSIDKSEYKTTQDVMLKTSVNFSELEEVFVIIKNN
jgi:rod shape-determining protein MreC